MPFPLAHPAAVLPFRRFCPRWLSFPALVAGSLAPDAGYLFRGELASDISHSLLGGTIFGFVVGLLMTLLLYGASPIILVFLSRFDGTRRLASSVGLNRASLPKWSTPAVFFSLLIGVWTHLFFDSLSHADGLLALHFEFLRSPVLSIGTHSVRVCHLLWYAFSFTGVALLVFAFRDWQARNGIGTSSRSAKRRLVEAFVVPFFVLPIELGHHFVRNRLGLMIVVVLTLALVIAFVVGMAPATQIENEVNKHSTGV